MLQAIDKEDTTQSIKLHMFDEVFGTNLESSVWSHHVGVPPRDTNMGG